MRGTIIIIIIIEGEDGRNNFSTNFCSHFMLFCITVSSDQVVPDLILLHKILDRAIAIKFLVSIELLK